MDCNNCNSSAPDNSGGDNSGNDLSDNRVSAVDDNNGPFYLLISVKRLIIMSILSFGAYETYWMYKNWSLINKRKSIGIAPFWRGVFGIFFCHKLLREIHEDPALNKIESPQFSASVLATWWVIVTLIGNFANHSRIENIGIEMSFIVVGLLTVLFFIPVQRYINKTHEQSGYTQKYKLWSAGHIVCLIYGGFFWCVIGFSILSIWFY